MSEPTTQPQYPSNWQIGQDYDPNEHLIKVSGNALYLNVQARLMWFIRDQRALIVAGLAKVPYSVQTELIELDRVKNWAHFKTYVRDVLGNEATMYGSESMADFKEFIEKASTKSLGRALLMLGYGTANAAELDEGDRVVDAPVARQQNTQPQRTQPNTTPQPIRNTTPPLDTDKATAEQLANINRLYTRLNQTPPDLSALTVLDARIRLRELSTACNALNQKGATA